MMKELISYLIFLCLFWCVFGDAESDTAQNLQAELNKTLDKAEEIKKALSEALNTNDLEDWLNHVQDYKLKEKIEDLQRFYNEIQYTFNKTSEMLMNLSRDWDNKLSEEHLKETGSRVAKFSESFIVVNNKVVNQSQELASRRDEYNDVDLKVLKHDNRYPNFDKRLSNLEKKYDSDGSDLKAQQQQSEELKSRSNLNRLEEKKMRLEGDILTKKHQKLEEMIKQLKEEIKILRENGVQQSGIASVNQILGIDEAFARGKKIRLRLVT